MWYALVIKNIFLKNMHIYVRIYILLFIKLKNWKNNIYKKGTKNEDISCSRKSISQTKKIKKNYTALSL